MPRNTRRKVEITWDINTNVVFAEGEVWVSSLQSVQVPKWLP